MTLSEWRGLTKHNGTEGRGGGVEEGGEGEEREGRGHNVGESLN